MQWEFSFLYALQELHNPILDTIMVFITKLGDAGIFWIALGVLFLIPKKHRKMGFQILIAMLCTYIIGNLILKNIFARLRPCDIDAAITLLVPRPHGHSFPSGHTMNGMVAAITMFLNNKKVGIPALILASGIAFSRMYLFVHFPTDIIGGIAVGLVVAIGVDILFRKIIEKRKAKA